MTAPRKPSAAPAVASVEAYPDSARPWVAVVNGITLAGQRGIFRRFASPGAAESAGWASAKRAAPAGREAARR